MAIATIQIEYLDEYIEVMDRIKRKHIDSIMLAHEKRDELTAKFAWAIPTLEALKAIHTFAPDGIVEVGAGTGYWAMLLEQIGVLPVFCYDKCPDLGENHWHKEGPHKFYHEVFLGGPFSIVGHLALERALMLCWPPYDDPMAAECMEIFFKADGQKLIFIGEAGSGCTGCSEFQDVLYDRMNIEGVSLPQWVGIHDALYLCTRKS